MAKPDFLVPVPDAPGLISRKNVGGKTYVYYETGREYLPERRFTVPKRVGIGKLANDGFMIPNGNFARYFPGLVPGAEIRARTSFTLRVGVFFVLSRLVKTSGLAEILAEVFGREAAGLVTDPPSSGQNVRFQLLKPGRKGDLYVQKNYRHNPQGFLS